MAEKKNAADQKTAKKRAKRLKKKQAKLNKLQENKESGVTMAMTTGEIKQDESEDESEGREDDAFENPFVIKGK